jgi:Tol biopolymer transport system component
VIGPPLVVAFMLAASTAASAAPDRTGQIAFARRHGGTTFQIFVMNRDGSSQRQVTHNTADSLSPAWSPDGRKIAFASYRRGGTFEIYVMGADGSDRRQLTHNADLAVVDRLAWSPDGRRIAFSSARGGAGDIYVIRSDGSFPVRLTRGPADDYDPAWSPDGKQIVFASASAAGLRVYVMAADGSGRTPLRDTGANDFSPTWSPDGREIAFASCRNGAGCGIYRIDIGGSGRARRVTGNAAYADSLAWSPDGRKLAFDARRNGAFEIYVMNADGSGRRRLTTNSVDDQRPDWQR